MDLEPHTPPTRANESDILVAFLDEQRRAVLRKLHGLDREQLTERLVPSDTTLLGILKHLIDVERWWFRVVVAGEDDVPLIATREDPEAAWRIEDGDTHESLAAAYNDEIERSNAIVAMHALDEPTARRGKTLRWVLLHMIEETARHAGQADILREQLDEHTGL